MVIDIMLPLLMIFLYLLHTKSEFYDVFTRFHAFVCNKFLSTIKTFQSDGGTELVNNKMHAFLELHGIYHRISCPYTP